MATILLSGRRRKEATILLNEYPGEKRVFLCEVYFTYCDLLLINIRY